MAILRPFCGDGSQTERRAECAGGINHRRSVHFRYEAIAIRRQSFDASVLSCLYLLRMQCCNCYLLHEFRLWSIPQFHPQSQ